jgi:hypothetical protein
MSTEEMSLVPLRINPYTQFSTPTLAFFLKAGGKGSVYELLRRGTSGLPQKF